VSQDEYALLVVDDNEDNRYTLTHRLKRQGYTNLTTAEDGRQALDLLRARRFDLVLLDIMMPELNGYQVLEQLKADEKLRHIPVIMISAVDEFESVIRCIELGAEDYLPKPFNPTLLKARIGASLQKKRLQDEVRGHLDRIEQELQAARELQKSMVPSAFPAPTAAMPVEVYAAMEPARQVGGDLYDFFTLDDGRFCFLVGDVSGKGVPAALFMARTKTLVRLVATMFRLSDQAVPLPHEILSRVNHELCRDNAGCMFVTLFLGMLDPRSGEVAFGNAGHLAPYVTGRPGGIVPLGGAHAKPLGIRGDLRYDTGTCRLRPGEGMFLFSDGITDALDTEGHPFTEDRLEATLQAAMPGDPARIVRGVVDTVLDFARGSHQEDDITALALRLVPVPGGPA
jgi:sigma-B regulation protein RsbU (phosphoserine phosphatase)